MSDDHLEQHKKHLRPVSSADISARRKYYRLRPEMREALPLICRSTTVGIADRHWREFIHPLDIVSFDDVKNWFGIPNHLARRKLSDLRPAADGAPAAGGLSKVNKRLLPDKRGFSFEKLDGPQRAAVRQMSLNLLYSRVSDSELRDKKISAVAEHMLQAAKVREPMVLSIPDLVVCPDDEVVFDRISLLLFNNVVIYGSGRITTIGHTKIHALNLTHVDA